MKVFFLKVMGVFFIFGGGVRKSGRNLVILWSWVCVLMALGRETMNRGVRPHIVFNWQRFNLKNICVKVKILRLRWQVRVMWD